MIQTETVFKQIPFLRKFYIRYRACVLYEGALSLAVWFLGLALLLLMASLLPFGDRTRISLLFIFFSTVAMTIAWMVFKLKKNLELSTFCRFLERKSPSFPGLLDSAELSSHPVREGISKELRDAQVRLTNSRLSYESPAPWVKMENAGSLWSRVVLLILITASLALLPGHPLSLGWNHILYGTSRELLQELRIDPQGGKVLLGDDVRLTVELLGASAPEPRVSVYGADGWEEVTGESSRRKFSYLLKNITRETKYKVLWKNLESPVYSLLPVEPPRLRDFTVKMILPEYTGLPPQVLKGEPQVTVLRGTRIELSAQASEPLEHVGMVSSDGFRYPTRLTRGDRVEVAFIAQNPMEFWFDLEGKSGFVPSHPARYFISVKEDMPPQIRLLAPGADLIVGKEASIPFTFEASDDMGVTSVFLKVTGEGGAGDFPPQRILLKRYLPSVKEKIDDALFSMGQLKISGGQILRMQLEAQDNDTVSGPKTGDSASILVEIRSYEKEHEQIEKDLKNVREGLLDLLARQTEARVPAEDWRSHPPSQAEMDRKMEDSYKSQSRIADETEKMGKKLEGLLDKMDQDPLTDFSILNEHTAIKDALEHLSKGPMARAQKALAEKNFEEASEEQDASINELERLSSLTEDVQKYGNMKDLLHSADRMADKGEALEKELSQSDSLNQELLRKLSDTLRETQEILSQIANQVKNLPRDLPEDFVNKPEVKQLDLGGIAKAAQDLTQSLMKGDLRSALKMAQELLKEIKSARDTIAKASEETSFSTASQTEKKAQEQSETLQKIIDKQEKLLDRTSRMESKRRESLLQSQKDLLAALSLRQKKVWNDAKLALSRVRAEGTHPISIQLVSMLEPSLPQMENVWKEFDRKNVVFSQKWLKEIIDRLAPSDRIYDALYSIQQSTSNPSPELTVSGQCRAYKSEESEILELLKNPAPLAKPFNDEELSGLDAMSGEQNGITEDVRKMRKELRELSAHTALLGPEIPEALKGAQGEMEQAGKSLKFAQTDTAQNSEQKALSGLRKSQEGLQSIADQMGKKSQSESSGGSGKIPMYRPRNAPGGKMGIRMGVVEIPRADEYLPPREFREEILESLKEKYPKSQENLIKDYYKKLSQ